MAAVFQQKDNLWREFLNPLRGLTMERIVQLVEQGELVSDGRGYLPNGTDVKYVNGGGAAGRAPFRDHLDYLDRQITLLGTGGLRCEGRTVLRRGSGRKASVSERAACCVTGHGTTARLAPPPLPCIRPVLTRHFPVDPDPRRSATRLTAGALTRGRGKNPGRLSPTGRDGR